MIRSDLLSGKEFCRVVACFLPAFAACFRLSGGSIRSRYQARLTERKLLALSDHQLKDIGVSRCQIWQLANDGMSSYRRGAHDDH